MGKRAAEAGAVAAIYLQAFRRSTPAADILKIFQ
jgi:hypothetical protein